MCRPRSGQYATRVVGLPRNSHRPRERHLPTLAGVVVGIDEVELKWGLAMYLHDNLSAGHGIVMHVRVEKSKTASGKGRHLACVKVIAHAHLECAFEHSDILAKGMKVRWDAVPVRHFQTHCEVPRCCGGIAFKHSKLCTGREERRCGTPGNGVGSQRVALLVRTGVGGSCEELLRACEQGDGRQCEIERTFHQIPPCALVEGCSPSR